MRMPIQKFIGIHMPFERYKREKIVVKFSKSGVDQHWDLIFNNGHLLTDEVLTFYNPHMYLRSKENCHTLEDVLKLLYEYSYNESFVRIVEQRNLLENKFGLLYKLNEILKFELDVKKLYGTVYFGMHTITFADSMVSFLYRSRHSDGTYLVTGKFDLLRVTNKIVNLASNMEFLTALKKIERQ